MTQPPVKPWEQPLSTPAPAPAPTTPAPAGANEGLLAALKRLLMGDVQPPPVQAIPGGGQSPMAIDPLQLAAQRQQLQQTLARGTGN